jgi:hypothetical protein
MHASTQMLYSIQTYILPTSEQGMGSGGAKDAGDFMFISSQQAWSVLDGGVEQLGN